MRVLHVCKKFSKLTETFIYDTITELEHRAIDVHVAAQKIMNRDRRPFESVHKIEGNHRLSLGRIKRSLARRLLGKYYDFDKWYDLRNNLTSVVNEIKPDIIHAHFGDQGVIVEKVARQQRIPLVTSFYGYDISRLQKKRYWRKAYGKLTDGEKFCVSALSSEMKSRMVDIGLEEEKINIIHVSRNVDELTYKEPVDTVQSLVSVGRLIEKKGHRDTIEAIYRLTEKGLDITLDIIGEGDLREELEALISKKNLTGRVRLLGNIETKELMNTLYHYDAFILCSKTASNGDKEGTPTVLVEAQAIGLPCVSTKHSGIPEIISPENHDLLAFEGDIDDIGKKIEKLVHSSRKQLLEISKKGREKVMSDFNINRENEKLISIYEGLLSK